MASDDPPRSLLSALFGDGSLEDAQAAASDLLSAAELPPPEPGLPNGSRPQWRAEESDFTLQGASQGSSLSSAIGEPLVTSPGQQNPYNPPPYALDRADGEVELISQSPADPPMLPLGGIPSGPLNPEILSASLLPAPSTEAAELVATEVEGLLDGLDDVFSDPMETVDRILAERNIGTGHDLRDVVDTLPSELLTERILHRALPGLSARWPELRLLVLDVLRAVGRDLVPDPADALLALMSSGERPPSTAAVDTDSFQMLSHEVSALRLLSPAEQRCLGEWIAEGQLVADLAAVFEQDHGRWPTPQETAGLLVDQVRAAWGILSVLLPDGRSSAGTWRTILIAQAYGTTTDDQLVQIAISLGLDENQARTLLRRAEAAIRAMPQMAYQQLADVLATTGGPVIWPISYLNEDTPDVCEVMERGRHARRLMVLHNLRLVLSIARGYASAARFLDFTDLVQEGTLGLMRAIDLWEPGRGYTFSTYATLWIRQAITRALADQDLLIRLPVHIQERTRPVLDDVTVGLKLRGPERCLPTEEEDALLALTVSNSASEEYIQLLRQVELSHEVLQGVLAAYTVGSLEAEGLDRAEQLADEDDSVDPEVMATAHDLRRVLEDVIGTLKLRERLVMNLRYGLRDRRDLTLEEVGQHLGVTRERIRQIENNGLRSLRHHTLSKHFRGFVPDERLVAAARQAASGDTHKRRAGVPEAPPPLRSPQGEPSKVHLTSVHIDAQDLLIALQKALFWSKRDERFVICRRLGLVGEYKWTHTEIAEALGVGLDEVWQMERDALRWLSDLVSTWNGELFLREPTSSSTF